MLSAERKREKIWDIYRESIMVIKKKKKRVALNTAMGVRTMRF